jgi:hypothetical protein
MNILEKLKSFGVKFEELALDAKDSKFVLTKDASAYDEFVYVLKFDKFPSVISVEANEKMFDSIIKHLVEKDFKILFVKGAYARKSNENITFINSTRKVTIELCGGVLSKSYAVADVVNADEDSPSDVLSLNICFDACEDDGFVGEFKDKFLNTDHKDNKGKILLFEKNEYNEMVLSPYRVKNYDLDISENYNDDFTEVHLKIEEWVKDFTTRNNKLVLLHGIPGSGKTNYIKYLLNRDDNIKKIYIPPYFVQSMADPSFFPVVRKEKESLLIIEDAEKILMKREDSADNSIISILLNLCDGIMADVLNFKIIATFNSDEKDIDGALKRKGRMFLRYKFEELSEKKTDHLYRKLHGIDAPKSNMTLAEIYNAENEFGTKKEEKKMGFIH